MNDLWKYCVWLASFITHWMFTLDHLCIYGSKTSVYKSYDFERGVHQGSNMAVNCFNAYLIPHSARVLATIFYELKYQWTLFTISFTPLKLYWMFYFTLGWKLPCVSNGATNYAALKSSLISSIWQFLFRWWFCNVFVWTSLRDSPSWVPNVVLSA